MTLELQRIDVFQGTKKRPCRLLTLEGSSANLRAHDICLTKGRGSVYNITFGGVSDPSRLWVSLGPLEFASPYQRYKENLGGLSFSFPISVNRDQGVIQTVDEMVSEAFARQFEGKRCGEIFITRETFNMIFGASLRTGQLTVKLVPDAVDVFDVDGNLLPDFKPDDMYLIGRAANVIVEPMFVYVSREIAVVHWRLRQMRLMEEIDPSNNGHDSDWSF